jgi:hypothetical protein
VCAPATNALVAEDSLRADRKLTQKNARDANVGARLACAAPKRCIMLWRRRTGDVYVHLPCRERGDDDVLGFCLQREHPGARESDGWSVRIFMRALPLLTPHRQAHTGLQRAPASTVAGGVLRGRGRTCCEAG